MNKANTSRTGSAEVAAILRRQITKFELLPFDRLPPERTLAQNFKVSRGTVRQALIQLESEGLLEIRASSGAYIQPIAENAQPSEIENARPLDLIDTRFALEPHICRLSVLHARKKDFEQLEDLLQKMEASLHDPANFGEIDTAFHSALAESTSNNLLIWFIAQIKTVRGQNEWERMRQLTLTPPTIQIYNRQHRDIVSAIKSREPEKAANAMKEHLETARQSLNRAAQT